MARDLPHSDAARRGHANGDAAVRLRRQRDALRYGATARHKDKHEEIGYAMANETAAELRKLVRELRGDLARERDMRRRAEDRAVSAERDARRAEERARDDMSIAGDASWVNLRSMISMFALTASVRATLEDAARGDHAREKTEELAAALSLPMGAQLALGYQLQTYPILHAPYQCVDCKHLADPRYLGSPCGAGRGRHEGTAFVIDDACDAFEPWGVLPEDYGLRPNEGGPIAHVVPYGAVD